MSSSACFDQNHPKSVYPACRCFSQSCMAFSVDEVVGSHIVGLFYTSRRQRKSHTGENPCARRVKWFKSLTTLKTWLTPSLPVNKYNNIMLGIIHVAQGIGPFSPLCFFQWTRHCFDIKARYWHFNYEKCSVNVFKSTLQTKFFLTLSLNYSVKSLQDILGTKCSRFCDCKRNPVMLPMRLNLFSTFFFMVLFVFPFSYKNPKQIFGVFGSMSIDAL